MDGRDRAFVEHLEEAKDAEVGEGAVPAAIRRLRRARDTGCVDHVYRKGGEKGEKGPAKDDKEDYPEGSLGELLVGREGSTGVVVGLCVCCSGIARILYGIVGWIRGNKGDRWVEEGKEAVGEGTWA